MAYFWPVLDNYSIRNFDDIIKVFRVHKKKIFNLIRDGTIDLNENWADDKEVKKLKLKLQKSTDKQIMDMIDDNTITFTNLEEALESVIKIDNGQWFVINYRGEHDDQDDIILHEVDMKKIVDLVTIKEVLDAAV